MRNALTIDVEEYFHPSEVQSTVHVDSWETLPTRVGVAVDRILNLLSRKHVTATFFVMGWVADHRPEVVEWIAQAGHEIGCHSYAHQLVYDLTPEAFREDTLRAVAAIERACGVTPRLYRAPSYSITAKSIWALDILAECGFHYDSSIIPVRHDRYGIPGFGRFRQELATPYGTIVEVPAGTVRLRTGDVIPVGGGGYLRMLPYRYTAAGIREINEGEGQPACIYFHPWEIDPQQPRLASGLVSRMRTYTGLRGMEAKLDRLLTDFEFSTMGDVYGPRTPVTVAAAG
jgi:polysaccharide deacetylase family protein (PEP-CTERM system associated)